MKEMSIRINVMNPDIQKIINNGDNTQKTNSYPEDVIDKTPKEQKKSPNLFNYKIKGVNSCAIMEDSNNLTQTAYFDLPIKDTILFRSNSSTGVKPHLYFNNGGVSLLEGQKVLIDIGYDRHYQTRFIGYISNFKEMDSLIRIELEDSMYKLKRDASIKKNFPKNLNIKGVDVPFNLTHMNQWIIDSLYSNLTDNPLTMIPKIRSYNTELGKVVMKTDLSPAEIYKYFFKDVYGMKIFFRNEYLYYKRELKRFDYLMQPVLYVGWSNWDLLPYNEIALDVNGKAVISDEQVFQFEELSDTKRQYSKTFKFMYPFVKDKDYNPIVENNLEWYNTDKDNIKITATSFSSKDQTKVVLIYQYGKFKQVQGKTETQIKDAEAFASMTEKQKQAYNKEVTAQNERDAAAIANSGIIADSNNLQTFNEIQLNYPNLTIDELKSKIMDFFIEYPDSGLRGSIKVLGEPYVRQGDIVQLRIDSSHIKDKQNILEDELNSEYVKYYVQSVTTTFNNSDGIRQEITIDKKVN